MHFAPAGIRVNAIAPGFFVTKQNQKLLFNDDGTPTPRTGKILAATPMGRFGEASGALRRGAFLLNNDAASHHRRRVAHRRRLLRLQRRVSLRFSPDAKPVCGIAAHGLIFVLREGGSFKHAVDFFPSSPRPHAAFTGHIVGGNAIVVVLIGTSRVLRPRR